MKKSSNAYPWFNYISNYMKLSGMVLAYKTVICKGIQFWIKGTNVILERI